jgi:hyperosmotically inducible protein
MFIVLPLIIIDCVIALFLVIRLIPDVESKLPSVLRTQNGDADTTRKVKVALARSKHLAPFDITVNTSDGVVTLTGQVSSEDTKSLAGQITRGTDGVKTVKEEITLDHPAAQPSAEIVHVEDLEIRVAILEGLAHSPELRSKNIDVKVENRSVTLSGSVETPTG